MKELIEVIAKALVEYPDAVSVTETQKGSNTVLKLSVDERDMGKVIGRRGRIAKAIRAVLKAAGIKEDKRVVLDIDGNESDVSDNE